MTKKLQLLRRLAIRFRHEERGAVLVLVAVTALGLAAIASFVIDYGRVMNAQKELQTAADAAALAAAQELPDGTAAANTALSYGATAGGKNTRPDLPNVVTSPDAKCLNYLQQLMQQRNCVVGDPPNAIKVDQDADVKLAFLGGLGLPGIHIHATALASMKGGTAYPLDVVIVLDRTGSMSAPEQDPKICPRAWCPGVPRRDEAVVRPDRARPVPADQPDQLQLLGSAEQSLRGRAERVRGRPSEERLSHVGHRSAERRLAARPGRFRHLPDRDGITAYTTAMQKAKDELNTNGRPNAQDVIIFFTDGEANYGRVVSARATRNSGRRASRRTTWRPR